MPTPDTEIEGLLREADDWLAFYAEERWPDRPVPDVIRDLTTALRAASEDSARLDWLESVNGQQEDRKTVVWDVGYNTPREYRGWEGPTLRAAIDAARAASREDGT
jgi:hypothetical protein